MIIGIGLVMPCLHASIFHLERQLDQHRQGGMHYEKIYVLHVLFIDKFEIIFDPEGGSFKS